MVFSLAFPDCRLVRSLCTELAVLLLAWLFELEPLEWTKWLMLAALLLTISLVFRRRGLITMRHTQIRPAEVSEDVVIRSV